VSKAGWLDLAEARKSLGSMAVSRLQLPSEEGEREVEAVRRVVRDECKQENGVRYHHFNVTEGIVDEVRLDCEKEGLRQRKGDNSNTNEEKSGITVEEKDKEKKQVDKRSVSKDPLRWFGLMPPSSLRRAQASFVKAVELTIEVANLQSELGGVQARLKFLRRVRVKAVEEEDQTEDVIENIDSSFSSHLSLRD